MRIILTLILTLFLLLSCNATLLQRSTKLSRRLHRIAPATAHASVCAGQFDIDTNGVVGATAAGCDGCVGVVDYLIQSEKKVSVPILRKAAKYFNTLSSDHEFACSDELWNLLPESGRVDDALGKRCKAGAIPTWIMDFVNAGERTREVEEAYDVFLEMREKLMTQIDGCISEAFRAYIDLRDAFSQEGTAACERAIAANPSKVQICQNVWDHAFGEEVGNTRGRPLSGVSDVTLQVIGNVEGFTDGNDDPGVILQAKKNYCAVSMCCAIAPVNLMIAPVFPVGAVPVDFTLSDWCATHADSILPADPANP